MAADLQPCELNLGTEIPIVDFSAMSLEHEDPLKESFEAVKILADQVFQAFSTIGFVYLKNHGIPQEMVDSVFKTYDQFFNLSPEVKAKYAKISITSPNGWDAVERERPVQKQAGLAQRAQNVMLVPRDCTSPDRPGDLKESFDVECLDGDYIWPSKELPHFHNTVVSFYQMSTNLALRILTVMAVGLKLTNIFGFFEMTSNFRDTCPLIHEPNTFTRFFNKMGSSGGAVQLRYNYYPKIPDLSKVKPRQIRCGEHTDYGAISVLFQDDIGGLEVENVNGQFVSAKPVKGTVLVNIADLMQRWTSDKLKSTVHRVMIPESQLKQNIPRRSLVLFTDPDHEEIIECVDGSNKYPPIKSGDWKKQRLLATYNF